MKLVRLYTRANDSAKIYTINKFGTKSSPMARKRTHKFHNILWNAYSYLKRRIMEFDRYLHTRILDWRNQNPLATPPPPWNGVYKADWNHGVSEWLHPFSLHGKCYVSASKPPILFQYALFRLGHLTVCLIDMLCGIIALKLIWLYNGWPKYVPLHLYQISTSRKSTDHSCHISLTLVSSFLLSLSRSLSHSLSLS